MPKFLHLWGIRENESRDQEKVNQGFVSLWFSVVGDFKGPAEEILGGCKQRSLSWWSEKRGALNVGESDCEPTPTNDILP